MSIGNLLTRVDREYTQLSQEMTSGNLWDATDEKELVDAIRLRDFCRKELIELRRFLKTPAALSDDERAQARKIQITLNSAVQLLVDKLYDVPSKMPDDFDYAEVTNGNPVATRHYQAIGISKTLPMLLELNQQSQA